MIPRGLIPFLATLLLLITAPAARGDGKVFSVIDAAAANIPDQQALIHFKNGVETLVIETRFTGAGREFAWVVPLPAKPEIIPVSTGLFPTLRAATAPELVQTGGLWSPTVLAVLLSLSIYGISHMPRENRLSALCLLLLVCLFGGACLLPSLGVARGISDSGVEIQDRQIVGAFETTTLTASSADDLDAWLKANGFATDARAHAAAADYIARGWCFVASKLRPDAQTGKPMTPHPLGFRFATAQAVYPLKLTSTGSRRLSVDLYLCADEMATCRDFSVAFCAPIKRVNAERGRWRRQSVGEVCHRQLESLIGDATTITKLSGTLTPSDMASDATVSWSAPRPIRHRVFSQADAAALCVLVALGVGWLSAIVRGVIAMSRNGMLLAAPVRIRPAVLAILAAAFVTYWAVPSAPTTNGRRAIHSTMHLRSLGEALYVQAFDAPVGKQPATPTLEWARAQIPLLAKDVGVELSANSGPREEDSPGNYTLTINGKVLEYRYSDPSGLEHLIPITVE